MGTTPTLLLPYPEPTDPADVPTDMHELATQIETVRGTSNGLAGLDAGSKVPVAQLPAGTANGVATLDATGKIPAGQLPATAGAELAYQQITAAVTVTVVAASAAVQVVSAGAVTFDGSPVIVDFYAPALSTGATGAPFLVVSLWADGVDIGRIVTLSGAVNMNIPAFARRKLTPAAGSHTYTVRAYATVSNGFVQAGTGTTPDSFSPAFIRITRA
jgi:hypothetical protein